MTNIVDNYVATCNACQSAKRNPHGGLKSTLGVIEAKHVNDMISIDLWDAGTTSLQGMSYVLTVIDGFSKFAYAIPIKNKEAITIARALHERVFTLGTPLRSFALKTNTFATSLRRTSPQAIGLTPASFFNSGVRKAPAMKG